MGAGSRRSSWVDPVGRRRRRRPLTTAVAALAAAVTVAAIAVTVVAIDAQPALALCDGDGAHCVDTAASSVAIVPLRGKHRDRLTVANQGATGSTEVGVVAYLTSTDPATAAVVPTTPTVPAAATVARGQRRAVALRSVPATARAVLVQLGGAAAKRQAAATRSACATAGTASPAPCATARVGFTLHHDHVTQDDMLAALQRLEGASSSAVPTASATALAGQLDAVPAVPAHTATAIRPLPGALAVAWRLDAGSEDVTAVRVSRDGAAADGSGPVQVDRPARSGRLTLRGLVPGRTYSVAVAPVIEGVAGTPITMTATVLADGTATPSPSVSASATASAAPTATATPAETATPSASASETPSSAPTASVSAAASASASASASAAPTTAAPSASSAPAASASPSSSATATAAPTASASATVATSAVPAVAASGTGIPATPAGWKLLYAQDFTKDAAIGGFDTAYPGWASYDGNTDTSRETGRPSGQVGVWNSDTTTSVANGVLDCKLWTKGVQPQVCAVTPDLNGSAGRMYGRYSVRFKADRTPGYKIAWLLWPGSNEWSQGEIDFPEGSLDGTITGNLHRADGDPSDSAYYVDTKQSMDQWRTATIDWRPGRVTFILDDQSWTTTDARGMPKDPMRWALQAETEIQTKAPNPSTVGHISIDWVAGYGWIG